MKNTLKTTYFILIPAMALLLLTTLFAFSAQAVEITNTDSEIRDDFVLEPAKLEVILEPGESVTRSISIVNRLNKSQTFKIEIEDFIGSRNPKETVKLLGTDKGPYSLKNNINLEANSVTLESKQRAEIHVQISVPVGTEPGGKYASVLVSTESDGETKGGAKTVSRIGALFLVRVAGPVNENGKLSSLTLVNDKSIYEKGPFDFELLYENNGSVHLVPNGNVEIKNFLGKTVHTVEVAPFFSLPDSLRGIQVSWDPALSFGKYTATAMINRGYQESPDVLDELSVSFWVLPWKIVVGLFIVIVIVAWVFRKILKTFEIKRK